MNDDALREALAKLQSARIFFGHQSVGANIIQGIDELTQRLDLEGPRIIGEEIGSNGDPAGKIRDFDRIMRAANAVEPDIAFMKLCYVDIDGKTNTAALFTLYRRTMEALSRDFPDVVFIHVTAPLTATGIKERIKSLLGRPSASRNNNRIREEYNDLLRQEYGQGGRLFDLALLESLGGENREKPRELRGEYTNDGGHLNGRGRRLVAENLAVFLAGFIAR